MARKGLLKMSYIIGSQCVGCIETDCIEVCPVEAIFDEYSGIPTGGGPFVKANYAFFSQDPPSEVADLDLPQGFEAQLNT